MGLELDHNILEWRSVVNSVVEVDVRSVLSTLDQRGVVAYTDGACLKNPGGPAGWAAILWATADAVDGKINPQTLRVECHGHIPRAATTTNNRAEISAVLAALSLAPPLLPLTIFSDSEYVIKVAQGTYQMHANTDLWQFYQHLLKYRKVRPTFVWVRGHAGQEQNELADELAGLAAWNYDRQAYARWQTAEEQRRFPPPQRAEIDRQVQKLQSFFDTVATDSGRVQMKERQFVNDMIRRLRKSRFQPTEKQCNWIKVLVTKYRV